MLRNSSFTPSCLSPSIFSVFASHLRIALPSLFCCFWAAARSRGAVRLIRARVQQAIRWAFVTSRVSNSGGWGSTAHPHSGKMATAKKIQRAEMKEILCKALSFIWVNLMHCTNIMLYAFYLCIVFLDYVITYFSLSSCMLYYVLIGHQLWTVCFILISLFLYFYLLPVALVKESLGFCYFLPPSSLVLLLLRHFPLFEPLLCHQGATLHFIPIP